MGEYDGSYAWLYGPTYGALGSYYKYGSSQVRVLLASELIEKLAGPRRLSGAVEKKSEWGFAWMDPRKELPKTDEGIIQMVLVEVDLGEGEYKLTTALYMFDAKKWIEMLTNKRMGHTLSNVARWSYIPEVEKERSGE